MINIGDKSPYFGSNKNYENYTVVSVTSEKVIGTFDKPGVGNVAIAMSRDRDMDEKISREFRTLANINNEYNGPRVVPLYSALFSIRSPDAVPNKFCRAYIMGWIEDALHSKTQKPQFERQLNQWGREQSRNQFQQAQKDLAKLDHFIRTKSNIGDLQLMLQQTTGHLFLIDPTGLSKLNIDGHTSVSRWQKLLSGAEMRLPDDQNYNKRD